VAVDIGGVRTNFRMPDILSVGLGGGSYVRGTTDAPVIGPDSVGYELPSKARIFGGDPFPYGLEANRKTLDAFCRFAHAQGVTAKRLTPDDLFPKEVRASTRV